MPQTTVGVIANPASGRDIRRLVTGASVFDNGEKGAMVHRLMAGLGAAGVDRVLMLPAGAGVSDSLHRHLRARAGAGMGGPFPVLEELPLAVRDDARDSAAAAAAMRARGVAAIVVLGGDGTQRVVAGHCGEVPLCGLSTGTNNAFAELTEATVAGLATGLVATGQVGGDGVVRRRKRLDVLAGGRRSAGDGRATPDCALVDVAVSASRWVGSRALWRPADLSEAVVAFSAPTAVGVSAVAAAVDPLPHDTPAALHLTLAPPELASTVVTVPFAPGLVLPVGVTAARRVAPGQAVALRPGPGCVALDGEREIELGDGETTTVRLVPGPLVIDIQAVMAAAAREPTTLNPHPTRETTTRRRDARMEDVR